MRRIVVVMVGAFLLILGLGGSIVAQATETVVLELDALVPFFNQRAAGTIAIERSGTRLETIDTWQLNLTVGGQSCTGRGSATERWVGTSVTLMATGIDSWDCPLPQPPLEMALGTQGRADRIYIFGVPFAVNPPLQPPFAIGPKSFSVSDAPEALPADYDLLTGHYFTQTGAAGRGYGVRDLGTDARGNTIRFWTYFQRYGGVDTLGYPVSKVFQFWDGFTYQAFQRGILQWRSEENEAWPANTLDWLHDEGLDPWLEAFFGVPPYVGDDSGGDWNRAKEIRLAWLTNPTIKARFLANPNPRLFRGWTLRDSINLYGLPTSMPETRGPFIVQRFQRGALQLWVEDVPGMPPKGSVVGVLVGDMVKTAGLLPAGAGEPESP